MLDRWVASLAAYDKARPNFALLREIPLRLREHAKRREDDTGRERAALETIERSALVADGIEPLEKSLTAAKTRLDEAGQVTLTAQKSLAESDAAHARLIADKDGGFAQATELLAASLARDDIRTLYNEALATPGPDDERILTRLIEFQRNLDASDAELAKTRETIREMAARRSELEAAREAAHARGYDQPFAGFGNESIIAEVIGGIVRGVLRSSDLGRVLSDGYTRRWPHSNTGFGGSSWPYGDWGGGGSSGGSGGGIRIRRFPTGGGSRGGGGFRTGGSF
jgi:hypothetical protein